MLSANMDSTALAFVVHWKPPEWSAVLRASTLGSFLSDQLGAVLPPANPPHLLRILELHLDLIRAAIDPNRRFADPARPLAEDVAEKLAAEHGLGPAGTAVLHDLHRELFSPEGLPRTASDTASVRILQGISGAHGQVTEGRIYRLAVELVPGGAGHFYPATDMLPIPRDDGWKAAEKAAEEFVRKRGAWPADADVRWRVTGQWDKPIDLDTALSEPSAGAAMGLALAQLLGVPEFKEVELDRLSISAELLPDGKLNGVGELDSKILGLLLARSMPAILQLGVAQSQKGIQGKPDLRTVTNTAYGSLVHDPGRPELHILAAPSLEAIAKLCVLDRSSRYPQADAHTHRRMGRTTGVVPMQGARQKVEDEIHNLNSGVIEIVGQAGAGKSTFMEELVRAQRERNPMNEPIVFFADADGVDRPEDVVREFYQQVRRKYGIEDVATNNAAADLRTVLGMVSNLLAAPDRPAGYPEKEILYLDAADQLKAPGPSAGCLLPDWVRGLPDHVVMVVTTRADRRWQDPARPQISRTLSFPDPDDDNSIEEYRGAVESWLTDRVEDLGLSSKFSRQVAQGGAIPVFKTVSDLASVRKANRTRKDLQDPDVWRRAPEETVRNTILQPALVRLQQRRISSERIWEILGLLAAAREALSPVQWTALKLWRSSAFLQVLNEVASLFTPRSPLQQDVAPYQFTHPDNVRIIRKFLFEQSATLLKDIHRSLGQACVNTWRRPDNPARWYALRYAAAHLLEAGLTDAAADLLMDIPYLLARLGADRTTWPANVFPDPIYRVIEDLDACMAAGPDRSRRESLAVLRRVLARRSHVLSPGVDLNARLLQELYNTLAFDPAASKPLREELRRAALKQEQPWIERRKPPNIHENPHLRRTLPHAAAITVVTTHRHQPLVATGCADGSVHVWHADTGALVASLDAGHRGAVLSLDFSPDNVPVLASAGKDGAVFLWHWQSKRQPAYTPLFKQDDWIRSVSFCRGRHMLACGGNDGFLRILDTQYGHILWEYRAHENWLLALAFSPDGRLLASSGYDGALRLWRGVDANPQEVKLSPPHGIVNTLVFNPANPMMLATDDVTERIILWDLACTPPRCTELPTGKGRPKSLAFHPAGQLLAASYADGDVRVWDVDRGCLHAEGYPGWRNDLRHAAFIAGGNLMALASPDRDVAIWDAGGLKHEMSSLPGPVHRRYVTATAFSSDGMKLATGEMDGTTRITDVHTGSAEDTILSGHDREVWSVAFSPDGKSLATGGRDKTIRLWDLQTVRLRTDPLLGHEEWVECVSFSPNGLWLASGDRHGCVRLWNAADGKPASRALWLHTGSVRALAFSPDSKLLATAGKDGKVTVVEAPGHAKADTFTGVPSAAFTAVSFDSHGQRLIAGDDTGALHLWSLDPSVPVERLAPLVKSPVTHLTVLVGTSLVAVATANGLLSIRSVADGQRARTIAQHACDNRVIAQWIDSRYAENLLLAEASPNTAPRIHVLRLHNVKGLCHDQKSV